jgi:hypothetical protein
MEFFVVTAVKTSNLKRIMFSLFYTFCNSVEDTVKSSQHAVSLASYGNGFQQWTFPFLWLLELSVQLMN